MRTIAQESAFQIVLKKLTKRQWGRSVHMQFWWRESTCNQAHKFCGKFLLAKRSSCHYEGFIAFLGIRRYKNRAHKIGSWKYWLSKDLFWPSQSTECLISAAAAACDSVLEDRGKCQWQVNMVKEVVDIRKLLERRKKRTLENINILRKERGGTKNRPSEECSKR